MVLCLYRPTLSTTSRGTQLCCARGTMNYLPDITFIFAGCLRSEPVFSSLFFFWILLKPFQFKRFVLINRSKSEDLERYHGRAINLHADDNHVPFHGAFLLHEMRVRGFSPMYRDRAVPLPILWADWIDLPSGQ